MFGEPPQLSGNKPAKGFDDPFPDSRDVYVPLLLWLHSAGVFSGLDSERRRISRQPTRQKARWAFHFWGNRQLAISLQKVKVSRKLSGVNCQWQTER
jgi:hypothetical protein